MATLDDPGALDRNEPGPAVAEPTPLLDDGQRLDQPTFHELYCQMPEDFRAELIDGVVHLNMPLYPDHAIPDADVTGLLYCYKIETPGAILLNNVSTKLGPRSEVQPDCSLLIDPAYGGRTGSTARGMIINAPELVVEVGSSTLRIDLNAKKRVYEEAGALEYLVFDVPNQQFHWFALRDGRFEPLAIDADGLYRSRAFPGLWLDAAAFLRDDGRAVMAGLRRGLESEDHAAFVDRLRQYRANRP